MTRRSGRATTARTSKFRYRRLSLTDEHRNWIFAGEKTEAYYAAVSHRCHVEVQRRCKKPNSDGSIRYVRYGFVRPDGTWLYSTQIHVETYLAELKGSPCTTSTNSSPGEKALSEPPFHPHRSSTHPPTEPG